MLGPKLTLDHLTIAHSSRASFDDLISSDQYTYGPLVTLNNLRNQTPDNGAVTVPIQGHLPRNEVEQANLEALFLKAGFMAAAYDNSRQTPVVRAVKRPPYLVEYDYGMALQECCTNYDIIRCHQFAEKVYYYKDFFYDYDVARQFDPNADVFAVVNSSDDILAVGRSVLRLPGYNCPFMHAVDEEGRHVSVPHNYRTICEVMGLYVEGREGIVAFKKLMESLTQYAYYIAQVDSVWTTYDQDDLYTGTYYRRKLLMNETGIRLTYRDFGGLWNLIFTDRIDRLKDVHENMFDR